MKIDKQTVTANLIPGFDFVYMHQFGIYKVVNSDGKILEKGELNIGLISELDNFIQDKAERYQQAFDELIKKPEPKEVHFKDNIPVCPHCGKENVKKNNSDTTWDCVECNNYFAIAGNFIDGYKYLTK